MIEIAVPGSKSMTQRALVIAALADATEVRIDGALVCDDSTHLTDVLRALGCGVEWRDDVVIVRPATLRGDGQPIFCGNAGTCVRFSAALALVVEGPLALDGNARMRQRPIAPLIDALAQLGVHAQYLAEPGVPPVRIEREGITPHEAAVACSPSSQFASGLMMVAPRLPTGLLLRLIPPVVSRPYLSMTLAMMQSAGATLRERDANTVEIAPGAYRPSGPIAIEPDWSGAAFILAAAFIAGREVSVPGLLPSGQSLQGDSIFGPWLDQIRRAQPGTRCRFDLTDAPDLLPPLTAAALFARGPVSIDGASHTRVKECDRLAVLARELTRLGAEVVERPDGLDITPLDLSAVRAIELEPEDDHRMAMTFGLLRLRAPQLSIRNPDCVSKSFPDFWRALAAVAN